jgi:hypothetical protein
MKPASTQTDKNMDFDGMAPTGTGRVNQKMQTNHWSGHANDGRLVNKGRGPTVAGRTGQKTPGSTGTVPALPAQGSVRDSINRGSQVRNPGGTTMCKSPANPDKIRVGQSGGPAYGGTTRGSRPVAASTRSDFNYGPKSQY